MVPKSDYEFTIFETLVEYLMTDPIIIGWLATKSSIVISTPHPTTSDT